MQMCRAFASAGHDVTLFSRPGTGEGDDYTHYGVDRVFDIVKSPAYGSRRIREWRYARATRNEMQQRGAFDLIYGRHLPSLALAARGEVPFVYEAHQPASRIGRAVERVLFRRRNLARVVFISEALRQMYLNRNTQLAAETTVVAHDGATPPTAHSEQLRNVTYNSRLRVGYSGSLYSGRGIEVITALARCLPGFDFHICGGSPEDVRLCRSRASDCLNMTFHGFLPPSQTPAWQASMDVLLAPYQLSVPTVEWMSPLKIFEYMASGTPIVASDLPALREVLTHRKTAVLVQADDVSSWVEALQQLKGPAVRASLGQQAMDALRRFYTWEQRAQRVLDGFNVPISFAA